MTYDQAESLLKKHGQEHLLQYFGEISESEKKHLLDEISRLDFSVLENLGEGRGVDFDRLSPADAITKEQIAADRQSYEDAGIAAIRQGKVAAVLLAGGQGTRLGSDKPKGMFDIGVSRELTIFEQQMNNIAEVTAKAGKDFHIFIMTSTRNNADTREFFAKKNYFGYDPDKIHFYIQQVAPTCSYDGKIFLEEKWKISTSPNGNGGWYSSLLGANLGGVLEENNIEWLNIYAVDNVLQRICDPVFIGATLKSGCACSGKVVKKVSPEEKVGVLCKSDGLPAIVEYYELPAADANRRDPDGELTYRYGVILNYLFSVEGLNKIYNRKLPYHLAKKAIPHMENGVKVFPDCPCGYKFETLAVDLVKLMGSCLAVEVEREREFAPVKNKTGVDSVESARELLIKNGVKL